MDESVSLRIEAFDRAEALEGALAQGAKALREQAPVIAGLSDDRLRAILWEAMAKRVDFDLFDWLAEAWTGLEELRALRERAGVAHQVFGKYPVKGELHLTVTVTIGAMRVELPFTLALIADFDALMLTVTDGRITEFLAGQCDLSLQASYKQVKLHDPTRVKSFALPFRHALKVPGLRIP